MSTNLVDLSAAAQRRLLANGEITALELTEQTLDRIEAVNRTLNAVVTVVPEVARRRAGSVPVRGAGAGCAAGLPVGLKDIFLTEGIATTNCSRILRGYVPPYSGTVVRKLDEAGGVLVGKLNMDEFAMGSSTEHSAFGPSRNPWDPSRVPGGSSGGSAAAVAAGLCSIALGTDTGGSIRQPAAFCGVVGMKPTYGRVSRYGVIAFASSLDQVGPFGRTVEDCAMGLQAVAGHDERDSTSVRAPVGDYVAAARRDIGQVRMGVPKEYFIKGLSPQVESAVRAAIAHYESLGAEIIEVSLPHTEYAIATYYLVATAEASSNLSRFDGVRYGHRADEAANIVDMYGQTRNEGFGAEVKRRIMLGTYVLSAGYYDAYYLRAQKVRTLIAQDFTKAFEKVDVVVTPTTPTTAFKHGENLADPLQMYLADVFTVPCNLAGLPGISLPCGFDGAGLPIGMQLLGKPFGEETLFTVAGSYERATTWHQRRPDLSRLAAI